MYIDKVHSLFGGLAPATVSGYRRTLAAVTPNGWRVNLPAGGPAHRSPITVCLSVCLQVFFWGGEAIKWRQCPRVPCLIDCFRLRVLGAGNNSGAHAASASTIAQADLLAVYTCTLLAIILFFLILRAHCSLSCTLLLSLRPRVIRS